MRGTPEPRMLERSPPLSPSPLSSPGVIHRRRLSSSRRFSRSPTPPTPIIPADASQGFIVPSPVETPQPQSLLDMEEEEEFAEVPFPFNRPNADIILRTTDLFEFRLHRQILLEASPVFETILSLPQPQTGTSELGNDDPPVIDIAESGKVLNALMRICYPVVKPKSRPFQRIEPVLQAALKYEMELPIAMLSDELLAHARQSPLKVWTVACRTGLEDVARRAAELMLPSVTLDIPGLGNIEGISAGHVFRLHEFHRLRGKVDFGFKLLTPPVSDKQPAAEIALPAAFVNDVPNPDIILCSSDAVDFPAHRGVVSVASPLLQVKIEDALRGAVSDEASSSTISLPKVQIDVSAPILTSLLKLCYPGEPTIPSEPSHMVDLLVASERVNMDRVHQSLTTRWSTVAQQEPLLAFLHATRAGLAGPAKEAAKHVLLHDFEGTYLREMEHAPALPYHRLLMHFRSCREISKSILSDVLSDLAGSHSRHGGRGYETPIDSGPYHSPSYNSQRMQRYPYALDELMSVTWLREHLKRVSETMEQRPGCVAATTEELVEAAEEAGQWCSPCQILAKNVCRVGKVLREIPKRVEAVEFEL